MNETPNDDELIENHAQEYAKQAIASHRQNALKEQIEARFDALMAEAGIPKLTDADKLKAMTANYLAKLENADLDQRAQAAARAVFEAKRNNDATAGNA
jgi:hypothetical protein